LKKFSRFKNTGDALKATTSLIDSKLGKSLKKFLAKEIVDKELNETLALSDAKLGGIIKEKMGIQCIHDSSIDELLRGVRYQMTNLISGLSDSDLNTMSLGLSHSLSRYKLKFSPDKVDTMIVQAICTRWNFCMF
jgi:nucleolar protein 58